MIVEAPAKVNLTLEVTGVEANGYHTLDTLFAWLDLHDTLELERAGRTSLDILSEGVSTALVTAGEDNLVLRALRALEELSGQNLPTSIRLTKRIPAGGGLGGGSADAAAALLGLRDLHRLQLDDHQLHSLAARLGADVAFGLVGGLARGRRYGEQLEPVRLDPPWGAGPMLLLAPGFPCPTPEVYRSWDAAPSKHAGGATERMLAAAPRDRLAALANDLQPAAERLYPRLGELREQMIAAGLEGVCLSGSGSTLFGFVPGEGSPGFFEKRLEGLGQVILTGLREDGRRG